MSKILVCVDGSPYADEVCKAAAWAAKRLDASVDVLHVLRRESSYQSPPSDHTGSLGLEDRTRLMEELAAVDEKRGRLDQQKGRLILEHACQFLRACGIESINTIHRRGSLSETVHELESAYDLLFLGKRGEQANLDSDFLGANLEKVARIVAKPLVAVLTFAEPIKRVALAFDGRESAWKAVLFAASSPLIAGLEIHLVVVEPSGGSIDLSAAEEKLSAAGRTLVVKRLVAKEARSALVGYVDQCQADLLLAGAYGHSRLRSLLLGSTTESLLKSCRVPVLMFR